MIHTLVTFFFTAVGRHFKSVWNIRISASWREFFSTQTLIDASKEVGLEVNVERTKYMLVTWDQNAGQNREMKIGNR
jgi:hypothetical protein